MRLKRRLLASLLFSVAVISKTETKVELERLPHDLESCVLKTELLATWYGELFHGKVRFDGEVFDMGDPHIAASPTLPMGTKILLLNKENGKSLAVVISDRMPKEKKDHQIDLSRAGAEALGFRNGGVIKLEAVIN